MAKTLVIGAAGFLGSRLVADLARRGHRVRAVTRDTFPLGAAAETIAAGDLLSADLAGLVAGMDVVINCAARVHAKDEADALAYDRINRGFATGLAAAAKGAGARRFVQLSSVAAVTSETNEGEVATDATRPRPQTPYGKSKLAADRQLAAMSGPGFGIVALRPPVIIGPRAAAWFGMLDRAARLGMPLPVGRIENRRSFIFVENVVDAVACASNSKATGCYIVTDSEPLSTAALYRCMLALHGHPDRVWNWPAPVTRLAAKVVLHQRASSLLGNAAYDGRRFCEVFSWIPPVSFDHGLRATSSAPPTR